MSTQSSLEVYLGWEWAPCRGKSTFSPTSEILFLKKTHFLNLTPAQAHRTVLETKVLFSWNIFLMKKNYCRMALNPIIVYIIIKNKGQLFKVFVDSWSPIIYSTDI